MQPTSPSSRICGSLEVVSPRPDPGQRRIWVKLIWRMRCWFFAAAAASSDVGFSELVIDDFPSASGGLRRSKVGELLQRRAIDSIGSSPTPGSREPEVPLPAEAETEWDKSEMDARSIYVGNVDYSCLAEEVQQHFQDCGTVNRVTILTDHFGHPKGYAYVEFVEVEAVQNALLLNDTELHDRRLKVCPKRTNIPGMNHPRGRRPYDPYYPPYPTHGMVPRFRRPPRYWPY